MKIVLLVNIAPVYISNDTCYPVEINEDQKLLSSVFTHDFTFVQVYTPIAKFKGKTYKELDEQITNFSKQNKIYDFESIIIKK